MFTEHVVKELSAYCNGELSGDQSRRVAAHLLKCERCNREYERIRLGVRLAEQLPQVAAPAEMWSDIEALLDARDRQPAAKAGTGTWFPYGRPLQWATAAALVLLIGVGSFMIYRRLRTTPVPITEPEPTACMAWPVTSLAGAPRIDGHRIKATGCFETGELLETDDTARVNIDIPQIGEVEIAPNSRVRLVTTNQNEHRMALERGKLHALITAPPRLFFVDTPSAEAIDLGCEYTLAVDDAGIGLLHVTLGWVMLVRDGRESYVPVDAMCETRPGVGPGTPFFEDASDAFKAALSRYDFENGGEAALRAVLQEARDRDTLTLWHLLQRVDEPTRAVVLNRMIALVGQPRCVTRKGILKLDREMLDCWKDALDLVWF
ncbi:MAG TPA: zf-HC2 domain-containing protein [Blastocatellia bacterium]|nr:zf-HC2 domain-containing protein [Blastocatellia bacterium]